MLKKSIAAVGAATALVFAATALAAPSNGGFESGDFSGWERNEIGGGEWFIYNDADGQPFPPKVGDYAAHVAQRDPGANFLHRTLNAKDGRFLSFYLAYDNEGESGFASPRTFRFGGDFDNQQARVDLLTQDAKLKSLRKSDILKTVFRTKKTSELSQPYEFYVVDLKEEGIKGKFQFRLAEVDNMAPWFVGLDEVYQSDLVP